MRFHRRHLEIAVLQFEEIQKEPAGSFYRRPRSQLKDYQESDL